MQASIKMILGHLIRWLLILLACLIVNVSLFSGSSFRVEKVVKHALNSMELPYAPIAVKAKTGQGYELLHIVDRKNAMHHQLFVKRTLGLFWTYRGGGAGMELDPQIMINFYWGSTTAGNNQHSYAVGQLNDPKVSRLQIEWWDGYEQDVSIKDGLYLATRSIRISKNEQLNTRMNKLLAYDTNGQLLYELNNEQREIRSDTKTETEIK